MIKKQNRAGRKRKHGVSKRRMITAIWRLGDRPGVCSPHQGSKRRRHGQRGVVGRAIGGCYQHVGIVGTIRRYGVAHRGRSRGRSMTTLRLLCQQMQADRCQSSVCRRVFDTAAKAAFRMSAGQVLICRRSAGPAQLRFAEGGSASDDSSWRRNMRRGGSRRGHRVVRISRAAARVLRRIQLYESFGTSPMKPQVRRETADWCPSASSSAVINPSSSHLYRCWRFLSLAVTGPARR